MAQPPPFGPGAQQPTDGPLKRPATASPFPRLPGSPVGPKKHGESLAVDLHRSASKSRPVLSTVQNRTPATNSLKTPASFNFSPPELSSGSATMPWQASHHAMALAMAARKAGPSYLLSLDLHPLSFSLNGASVPGVARWRCLVPPSAPSLSRTRTLAAALLRRTAWRRCPLPRVRPHRGGVPSANR